MLEFYQAVNSKEKRFEIIYIPFEETKVQYDEFISTMPWLCLPYKDPKIKQIQDFFKINIVPTLILINPEGKVAIPNARFMIEEGNASIFENWVKKY